MTTRKIEFVKRFFGPMSGDELEYGGRAKGIIPLPEEVAYCGGNLIPEEKVLWLILFAHCPNRGPSMRICWPSQEWLAILMGRSTRQIKRYIRELKRKGYLQTIKRTNKTSLYRLLDPPKSDVARTKTLLTQIKVIQKRADNVS